MADPGSAYDDAVLGKDPQPKNWDDYVRTCEDNGGVHINSGIPNHAFWRLATQLGGNAWERPGRIWYDALRDRKLRTTATFREFARHQHEVAKRLYGNSSAEAAAVEAAWHYVGVRWPKPTTMQLRLRRTGGVTGVTLDTGVIDSAALEGDHAEALRALAEQPAARRPAPGRGARPDRFTYELTADDRATVVPRDQLTPALRTLIKDLERHARAKRKAEEA